MLVRVGEITPSIFAREIERNYANTTQSRVFVSAPRHHIAHVAARQDADEKTR